MSRNFYKSNWVQILDDETLVIDSNEKVAKRLEKLAGELLQEASHNTGDLSAEFSQGLEAENVAALLEDQDGMTDSNLIKGVSGIDLEEIQNQANAIIEDANMQANQILEQASDEAKRMRDDVIAQARQEGYEAGMRQASAEAEVMKNKLNNQRQELEAQYQQMMDALEPQFVDTITAIYEHIFAVDLQNYKQILVQLISSTMRSSDSNRNFLVHVSQEDYPFVGMAKKNLQEDVLGGRGTVDIIEDIALSKGQCLLETENGVFDCGMDTQLAELSRKLRLLSFERNPE